MVAEDKYKHFFMAYTVILLFGVLAFCANIHSAYAYHGYALANQPNNIQRGDAPFTKTSDMACVKSDILQSDFYPSFPSRAFTVSYWMKVQSNKDNQADVTGSHT